MKFGDLKWAVGTFVTALRDPNAAAHIDCECHPKLSYRGPRQADEVHEPAPEGAGSSIEAARSGRSAAGSAR